VAGACTPRRAVDAVTRELQQALDVEHVFLLSSGRAALTVLLRALHAISGRRRVVVPAYTCYSVPAAVVRAGLDLTPCDVVPETLDFDYRELEARASEAPPLCVVSTHLFGIPADAARARRLCEAHGAFLVEDAAQAFGSRVGGRFLGTSGDAGIFSFARGKMVSAGGGGAIVTRSPRIGAAVAEQLATLPQPGAASVVKALAEAVVLSVFVHPNLYWLPARLPFLGLGETVYSTAFGITGLSGANAGLLAGWKDQLARLSAARASHIKAFDDVAGAIRPPAGAPCLRLPVLCASREERDRLCAPEVGGRLGLAPMYPASVDRIPALRDAGGGRQFPGAAAVAERLLTIPLHALVGDGDVEAIRALTRAMASRGVEA
jgi:dTDP-4-amino-4,6-dideoxygalactose transaminase